MALLENVINTLKVSEKLSEVHREHSLSGKYNNYQEFHIRPDWLLINTFRDDELWLDRTGTHSDLLDM